MAHRTPVTTLPLPPAMAAASVRKLFRILGKKNLRFVGGCVRNALMGMDIGDIDFATPLPPATIIEKLAAHHIKVVPTGIDHGTVTAVMDGIGYEITTLRHDIETDGRHATVAFTDDWAADAARRDFTINALYADSDGNVYDPLGTGVADIAKRKVRFIGDPAARIVEDRLRILRFFRFYTYYGRGQPDAKSLAACADLAAGMNKLSRERISKEFFLILRHRKAAKTIDVMLKTGILDIYGINKIDTKRLDLLIKFGDKGKKQSDGIIIATRLFALRSGPHQNIIDGHKELIFNKKIISILKLLSSYNFNTQRIDYNKIREWLYFHGPDITRALIDMTTTWQNIPAREHTVFIKFLDKAPAPVFPVTGADLLARGAQSGPALGETLQELEHRWITSGFTLTKEELLR